jgi:hypothetical protein
VLAAIFGIRIGYKIAPPDQAEPFRTSVITLRRHEKKPACAGFFLLLAERVRFELTVPHNGTLDFESSAFDHSATFPDSVISLQPIHCCKATNYNR